MRLRWFELATVDKGTSVIGLAVGGAGTLTWALSWAILIIEGLFSSEGNFGFSIGSLEIVTIVSVLFLVPFLSALGLLLLPLKDEQRGILSFISLIGALCATLPTYIVLFVVYCSATHSTCS